MTTAPSGGIVNTLPSRLTTERLVYQIDPARADLALEFKAKPSGPHSAELQKVLNVMRWQPNDGKHVLVSDLAGNWYLGQLPGRRGVEVSIDESVSFESLEAGMWHLFKLRWEYQTGHKLEGE